MEPIDRNTFWIVTGALGSGILGALGLWWAHIRKCNDRERHEGKLEEKVERMEKEIGDHETGIIGQLHRYSKAITRIFSKLGIGEP